MDEGDKKLREIEELIRKRGARKRGERPAARVEGEQKEQTPSEEEELRKLESQIASSSTPRKRAGYKQFFVVVAILAILGLIVGIAITSQRREQESPNSEYAQLPILQYFVGGKVNPQLMIRAANNNRAIYQDGFLEMVKNDASLDDDVYIGTKNPIDGTYVMMARVLPAENMEMTLVIAQNSFSDTANVAVKLAVHVICQSYQLSGSCKVAFWYRDSYDHDMGWVNSGGMSDLSEERLAAGEWHEGGWDTLAWRTQLFIRIDRDNAMRRYRLVLVDGYQKGVWFPWIKDVQSSRAPDYVAIVVKGFRAGFDLELTPPIIANIESIEIIPWPYSFESISFH